MCWSAFWKGKVVKIEIQTAVGKKSFGCGAFRFLSLLLLITAVFSSGCQTYTIGVSGVGQEKPQTNSTFVVVVRCDEKMLDKESSRQLREMAEHVLMQKGLVLAENKATADTVVVLNCGVSAPEKRTRTEYVVEPSSTPYADEAYEDSEFAVVNWNSPEKIVKVDYTVFTKRLVMRAFPGKKHSGNSTTSKPLWKVEAKNTDEVSNLKTMMPYLVIAAAKYAGDTIDGVKNVKITKDGKKVRELLTAVE